MNDQLQAFDRALAFTLAPSHEGGLQTNPLDRGGITFGGVTQGTYDAWRSSQSLPARPVTEIDDDEERDVYLDVFWKPCHCDELPPALAISLFDMAVNSGPWNAKLALQRALGVKPDGVIGAETIAAAKRTPDAVLYMLKQRAGLIADDVQQRPSQATFLHGWVNRMLDLAWMARAELPV